MLELTVRAALGVLAIAAVVVVLRVTRNARARAEPLALLSRHQLTRGGSVALVRVADRGLVLGVTEQGISLLTETRLAPDHPPPPVSLASSGSVEALSEPDASTETPAREGPDPRGDRESPDPRGDGESPDPRAGRGDPDDLVFGDHLTDDAHNPDRDLAPRTWRDAVDALRERTVRRPADPGSAIEYHVRTVRRP